MTVKAFLESMSAEERANAKIYTVRYMMGANMARELDTTRAWILNERVTKVDRVQADGEVHIYLYLS